MTDTADLADVVLPATMQPEHADFHDSYGHLYLSWNEPAVPPPGECLPNSEILRRIAARLGSTIRRCRSPISTSRRRCSAAPASTSHELRARRLRARRPAARHARRSPTAASRPPAAGSSCCSQALVDAGRDGLPTYVPPFEAVDDELAERFPLVLLAPAGRFFLNSTFAQLDWHRGKMGPPTLWLHPDDAAQRGLVDGDTGALPQRPRRLDGHAGRQRRHPRQGSASR